jgi:integrase/recombinase XerC
LLRLHLFDPTKGAAPSTILREELDAILKARCVPAGRPIFFNSGGLPDASLDGFVDYLIDPDRKSSNTWKSYAQHIAVFIRYLDAQGKHWTQATEKDLKQYYRVRCKGAFQSLPPIKDRSWNIAAAAIVHLYEYAVEARLVEKPPFSYRRSKGAVFRSLPDEQGRVVADLSAKATPEPINFIELQTYLARWPPPLLCRMRGAARGTDPVRRRNRVPEAGARSGGT